MRHRLVFASFLVAGTSCFADVVPISVSQQFSGSGSAAICALTPMPGCVVLDSASFNLADTNPGSATASANGFTVESSASGSQTSSITANDINLQMLSLSHVGGSVKRGGADSQITNEFDLEFDLTTPSILHLTGSFETFVTGVPVSFNAGLSLSGLGIDFHAPSFEPFDLSLLLAPGIYDLSAVANMENSFGSNSGGFLDSGARMSLDASFTPVPEPFWAPVVPSLLLLTVYIGFHRRRSGPSAH